MAEYIIAKPCHEDWAAMTPTERGRHCAHCDKVVVDLTVLAPAQARTVLDEAHQRSQAGPGQSVGICVRGHARPQTRHGHVLTGGMALLLAFGGVGAAETSPVGGDVVLAPDPVESQEYLGRVAVEPVRGEAHVEPLPVAMGEIGPAPSPAPMMGVVAIPAPVVVPVQTVKDLEHHRGWTLVGEYANAEGQGVPQAVLVRAPFGKICERVMGPDGRENWAMRQCEDPVRAALAAGKRFTTPAEARAWIDGVEEARQVPVQASPTAE